MITCDNEVTSAGVAFRKNQRGHIRIGRMIRQDVALALREWLEQQRSWELRLSDGQRILGLSAADYRACSVADLREFTEIAYSAARHGFAFLREELASVNLRDRGLRGPLGEVLDCLGTREFKRGIATIVGSHSVELVRLGLERYRCGHFYAFTCGAPNDAQIGFSLDLTDAWPAVWGGLLQFADFLGSVEYGYVPDFNTLVIYDLQKPRSISYVAPLTQSVRYSLVGQLRLI